MKSLLKKTAPFITGILFLQFILFTGCEGLIGGADSKDPTTPTVLDVTSLTITPEKAYLTVGETLNLTSTITPSDATNKNISWLTTDSSVATVSSDGVITAQGEGGPLSIIAVTEDGNFVDTVNISVSSDSVTQTTGLKNLTFAYDHNSNYSSMASNIYAVWIENKTSGERQNLFVCKKAPAGSGLTDGSNVLSFWKNRPFWNSPSNSVTDAVTSATIAEKDFTLRDDGLNVKGVDYTYDAYFGESVIDMTVEERMGDQFTIYFEQDQSWVYNAWFTGSGGDSHDYDQPSVLYAADIDLTDNSTTEYTLEPVGWTNMYANTIIDGLGILTEVGNFISDLRYITHSKSVDIDGNVSFGSENPSQSALRCISSITVTVSDAN